MVVTNGGDELFVDGGVSLAGTGANAFVNNGTVLVSGDITAATTGAYSGTGTGSLTLIGNQPGQVLDLGSGATVAGLKMEKTAGFDAILAQDLTISNGLSFVTGRLIGATATTVLTLASTATASGDNDASYYTGIVQATKPAAATSLRFPIGTLSLHRPLELTGLAPAVFSARADAVEANFAAVPITTPPQKLGVGRFSTDNYIRLNIVSGSTGATALASMKFLDVEDNITYADPNYVRITRGTSFVTRAVQELPFNANNGTVVTGALGDISTGLNYLVLGIGVSSAGSLTNNAPTVNVGNLSDLVAGTGAVTYQWQYRPVTVPPSTFADISNAGPLPNELAFPVFQTGEFRVNTSEPNYEPGSSSAATVTVNPYLAVDLRAFLQGPYNSGTNTMNTTLNTVLATAPTAASVRAGLHPNSGVPSTAVDQIFLQLRQNVSGATAAAANPVFEAEVPLWLHADGSVSHFAAGTLAPLSQSGFAFFSGVPAGDYFVVVRHRNHLAMMSKNAVTLNSTTPVALDLTRPENVYANNAFMSFGGQTYIGPNTRIAMFGGNVVNSPVGFQYEFVNAQDWTRMTLEGGSPQAGVYSVFDTDFNGNVNSLDVNTVGSVFDRVPVSSVRLN